MNLNHQKISSKYIIPKYRPGGDENNYRSFSVVLDDILGRYFGMILQYFSQLKKKTNFLLAQNSLFFLLSLPVEKENNRFSS